MLIVFIRIAILQDMLLVEGIVPYLHDTNDIKMVLFLVVLMVLVVTVSLLIPLSPHILLSIIICSKYTTIR